MSSLPTRIKKIQSKRKSLEWPNFEFILDFMAVLVTRKNEEDSIQNEGHRVATTLYVDISDPQGHITP